jgi:hypothetical protein
MRTWKRIGYAAALTAALVITACGGKKEAAQSAPTPEPVTPTPEPVAPEPVADRKSTRLNSVT